MQQNKPRAIGFQADHNEQVAVRRICKALKVSQSSLLRAALTVYKSVTPALQGVTLPSGVFEGKRQGQRT